MILKFPKTEIIISEGLRWSLHGIANKAWFGIQLFRHVLFFHFNFSYEVICLILFSHMWRHLYCLLTHTESGVWGHEEMNLIHNVDPTVNTSLWRIILVAAVQSFSRVQLFATPWTSARQASLSFTVSWSLLRVMSIESVMPSSHLILCHPLLLLFSIFPSIMVLSNESALHIRWPKYRSFSISISPKKRIKCSTINAENYANPRLDIWHNWSVHTPGSLLILSLNIKDHVTVSF